MRKQAEIVRDAAKAENKHTNQIDRQALCRRGKDGQLRRINACTQTSNDTVRRMDKWTDKKADGCLNGGTSGRRENRLEVHVENNHHRHK